MVTFGYEVPYQKKLIGHDRAIKKGGTIAGPPFLLPGSLFFAVLVGLNVLAFSARPFKEWPFF